MNRGSEPKIPVLLVRVFSLVVWIRGLADVAAVDVHVIVAEIAGPDPGFGLPLGEVQIDLNVVRLQRPLGAGLRRNDSGAPAIDGNAAQPKHDAVRVERNSAVPRRGQDPSPVQLLAVERSLYERRVRDGLRNLPA